MIPDSVRLPLRELRELGARGALFRVRWEAARRLGARRHSVVAQAGDVEHTRLRLPAAEDAVELAATMGDAGRAALEARVERVMHGELRMFGRWYADAGAPLRWHRDPVTGYEWRDSDFRTATDQDVKFVWELGRFPHAWDLARAAVADKPLAITYANRLRSDVLDFRAQCAPGAGVQWSSGQEAAIRLATLWFADAAFDAAGVPQVLEGALGGLAIDTGIVIERDLDYARHAVYNNHLLWEALGLYAAGVCVPTAPRATHWRDLGHSLLVEQATRQFYEDGGYIQQSHTYHRMAIQAVLMACIVSRTEGREPAPEWHAALSRSIEFLLAQMNPADGQMPNYGANDGAQPLILCECDYTDFRPTLTAAAVEARRVRPFGAGPWDEEAYWLCGADAMRVSANEEFRASSASFAVTGIHVLRPLGESFATFRCGTLRDRFSQIDMLHADVWWRGANVAVDGGSYRYNGVSAWHNHFMRTAAHNTVTVDDLDQMVHYRQFKCLYPAEASLLRFDARADTVVASGEHRGFERHYVGCVHRRSILQWGDDVWVVVDRVSGSGVHRCRLHWLAGAFPWTEPAEGNGVELRTPNGVFKVHVYDEQLRPLRGDIATGQDPPPRGWMSRYYGEKTPVPSFAANQTKALPATFITVLAGCAYDVEKVDDAYLLRTPSTDLAFTVRDGLIGPDAA